MLALLLTLLTLGQIHYPALTGVDYTPANIAANDLQHMSVYIPDGPKPKGGYPWVANLVISGFNDTAEPSVFGSASNATTARVFSRLLDNGVMIFSGSCTVSRGGNTGNAVSGGPMGVQYQTGNGCNFPDSTSQYNDPSRPMPYKDIVYLIQHIKKNRAYYLINPSKGFVYGGSAGGMTAARVGLSHDRAFELGTLQEDTQYGYSTKVCGAVLAVTPMWWNALFTGHQSFFVSSYWDEDLPASSILDAVPSDLDQLSPLGFIDPDTTTEVYLAYNEPAELSGPLYPYPSNLIINGHSSDFAVMYDDDPQTDNISTRIVLFSQISGIAPYWTIGIEDSSLIDTDQDGQSPFVLDVSNWILDLADKKRDNKIFKGINKPAPKVSVL